MAHLEFRQSFPCLRHGCLLAANQVWIPSAFDHSFWIEADSLGI